MGVDWVLVPCLVQLRTEFNRMAPGRDKASDGTIADALHSSASDHTPDEISDALRGRDADGRNEVHALDVDADLRLPNISMEHAVQHILARCRAGTERRLRYIIYRRRIWSASDGWEQAGYNGKNAHDQHAHFSASYDTIREASTASWGLEELVITDADLEKIRKIVQTEVAKVVTLDGDPGERTYSLGGLVTSIERRTADDDDRFNGLKAQLERIEAALPGAVPPPAV